MSVQDSNNYSPPPSHSRKSKGALNDMPLFRPVSNNPNKHDLSEGRGKGSVPPREGDIVIAIVGQTGVGKSRLIEAATGGDRIVGHGLRPFTKQITPIRAPFAEHIVLVDTPGFDGVSVSDMDTLKLVLDWFQRTYGKGFYLSGILYLYPISYNRLSPPSLLKNLDIFQKLCGDDSFRKLILGTTMWQDVDLPTGLEREAELANEHWAEMLKRGSQRVRFENTPKSAWRILNRVIAPEGRPPPGRIPPDVHPSTASSATEGYCHILVSQIFEDKCQGKPISELTGDDAQHMADFLNVFLFKKDIPSTLWERGLFVLHSLIKSARIPPRCHELKGVVYDPNNPVERGAFADIYKGKHRDGLLCLKVIRLVDTKLLWMHGVEPIRHAHLAHENIMPFCGVYYINQAPKICLVSPWMKNGNLRNFLDHHPQHSRMPFIIDVVNGLSYLHGLDIIHSDLKPQNVLVSDEGRALITDFGISYRSMVSASMSLTTSAVGGTMHRTAPELLTGNSEFGEPTKACDIWSFGCLCYELFFHHVPFYQYRRDAQVIAALTRQELPQRLKPRDIGADARDVVDRMWDLMLMCWNYTPQDRPNCEGLRDFIAASGRNNSQPRTTMESTKNHALWEAMRDESTVDIDYDQVENILLRIKA